MSEKKDHRWIYVPEYECLAYVDPATGTILTRAKSHAIAFDDECAHNPADYRPEFLAILAQHFDMSKVKGYKS